MVIAVRAIFGIIMMLLSLLLLIGAFTGFAALISMMDVLVVPIGIAIGSVLCPELGEILMKNVPENFIFPLLMLLILSWITGFAGKNVVSGFYGAAAFGIGGLWVSGFIPENILVDFVTQYSDIITTIFIIYFFLPIIVSFILITVFSWEL